MEHATLVVCQEEPERAAYSRWLRAEGYRVVEAASMSDAVAQHERLSLPLTIAELDAPPDNGLELIHTIRAINASAEVVMLSADVSPLAAVAAMKAGAADLLLKPVERDALLGAVRAALGVSSLLQENRRLRDDLYRRFDFSNIVALSPQMLQVLELAGRVAPSEATVLITGESGTGKELLAGAIHVNSRRTCGPMVSINCAAIPETLIESELFGYRRGSFTGASTDKAGLLAAADGGTLFLDEVADLSAGAQAKLLRFLQEGTYFPIGSTSPCTANVRIIAATNAPIVQRVQKGGFREDLYYRLSVFPIHVPPLRQRPQDIAPLAQHFLQQIRTQVGKPVPGLSREVIRYLTAREWRGNARELRNAVERAVIVSAGNLLTSADFRAFEFPTDTARQATDTRLILPEEGINLTELNRRLIAEALERTHYNISAASRLLGLGRATLRYRVKKYGLNKSLSAEPEPHIISAPADPIFSPAGTVARRVNPLSPGSPPQ